MQLVWLCVYIHISFEDTFDNSQWEMSGKFNPCDYASSQATHVRRHLKKNAQWKNNKQMWPVWLMHSLWQAIWGDIWKHTVEKNQINVNSVTLHPLRQAIWKDICKHRGEKSNKCNECDFASAQADNLRIHVIMNPHIACMQWMRLIESHSLHLFDFFLNRRENSSKFD